ncbi:hypothetical protein [Lachnoclostridium sp. An181]|uniref:hypothetical protein n=1 Tax=Lachnoclostridium sp. An181 TaxID=1965575 RepID=UPI000B3650E5|nr:hypothetical protein [Lachnoclostridium sp. An181]OUP51008.1 hypothetical protein B5F18_02290 [Lachnoclostridium sp. An181]
MEKKEVAVRVVAVILVILAGALLWSWNKDDKEKQEQLVKKQERIAKYDLEIQKITDETAKRESEINVEMDGYCILAFSAADGELMTKIFPAMQRLGLKGTVVLNNGALPGTKAGKISKANYKKLLDAGWDTAVGGSTGKDAKKAASTLRSFQEQLKKEGYPGAVSYLFEGQEYKQAKAEIYPVVHELGFQICGAKAANESILASSENEEEQNVMECQNLSLRSQMTLVQDVIGQAISQKKPLILSDYTGAVTWDVSKEKSMENLVRLLEYVHQKQTEGKIGAGNFSGYLAVKEQARKATEQNRQAFEQYKQEQTKKIEELQKKKEEE